MWKLDDAILMLAEWQKQTNDKLDKLVDVIWWLTNNKEEEKKEKLIWANQTKKIKKLYILRTETLPNSNEFQLFGPKFKTMDELHAAWKKSGKRYTRGTELIPSYS